MSEYEGLNLPSLLARMHDLALPEPASWWPETGGWWVLAIWLLALIGAGLLRVRRKQADNRYRREALEELQRIDLAGDPGAAAEIAAIVRRCALTVFPRQAVASLHGDAWAEFLLQTSPEDPVIRSAAADIARASYDPDVTAARLLAGAERWIRSHGD